MIGNFSKYDGTIEFYGRVRALIQASFIVVDLGAGRGAWYADDKSAYRKAQRFIKGAVTRLIGCDVDTAILENTSTHDNKLIEGGRLPFDDRSIDVVIADYVLEHITDPASFYMEIDRILKPGGFFCARTPHALNYVALAARFIRNTFHARLLKTIQPARKSVDVFPTSYQLNTLRAIRRYWRPEQWDDYSYLYTAEPEYVFGSRAVYAVFAFLHKVLPAAIAGNLFVFLRKKSLETLHN